MPFIPPPTPFRILFTPTAPMLNLTRLTRAPAVVFLILVEHTGLRLLANSLFKPRTPPSPLPFPSSFSANLLRLLTAFPVPDPTFLRRYFICLSTPPPLPRLPSRFILKGIFSMCPPALFRFYPAPVYGPLFQFPGPVPRSSRMPLTPSPFTLPIAATLPFNIPSLPRVRFPAHLQPYPPDFRSRPRLIVRLARTSAFPPILLLSRRSPILIERLACTDASPPILLLPRTPPTLRRWLLDHTARLPHPHSQHLPRFPFTSHPPTLLRRPPPLPIHHLMRTSLLSTVPWSLYQALPMPAHMAETSAHFFAHRRRFLLRLSLPFLLRLPSLWLSLTVGHASAVNSLEFTSFLSGTPSGRPP